MSLSFGGGALNGASVRWLDLTGRVLATERWDGGRQMVLSTAERVAGAYLIQVVQPVDGGGHCPRPTGHRPLIAAFRLRLPDRVLAVTAASTTAMPTSDQPVIRSSNRVHARMRARMAPKYLNGMTRAASSR